jgi:hypothetical protein
MLNLYRIVLSMHVAAGIIGLSAFWTPAVVKKGGAVHVRVGRIFYKAACAIAVTGLLMAALLLIDPLGVHPQSISTSGDRAAVAAQIRLTAPFLLFLVLITFAPAHHGMRVIQTRRNHAALRTPFHTAINVTAIAAAAGMIALGIWARQPVFAALSPIGFLTGGGHLRFARRPPASPMAWWYEHMGSMLGGGIAFHTAFLVVGAGRLMPLHLNGLAAVIPWLLPSIIGIPATAIWVAYYRRKFHEDAPAATPDAIPSPL